MGFPNAMLRVIWPDGTELLAEDARDLLARLGSLQWTPLDAWTMKRRLADRAAAWSGADVDPELDDHSFLRALEGAGMLTVVSLAEQAKPSLHLMAEEPSEEGTGQLPR